MASLSTTFMLLTNFIIGFVRKFITGGLVLSVKANYFNTLFKQSALSHIYIQPKLQRGSISKLNAVSFGLNRVK